jgi:hypothetical protein
LNLKWKLKASIHEIIVFENGTLKVYNDKNLIYQKQIMEIDKEDNKLLENTKISFRMRFEVYKF